MCPRIFKQSYYNLHRKHYTAWSKKKSQYALRKHQKSLQNHLQGIPKCTQNPPWDPPWNQTWKKRPNYALQGAPREPKILPKSTQGGARAPNWRIFVVKMPLLKASRFSNACLNVFWCVFEGPDPTNSMVFSSPNKHSLLLHKKQRFLSLFGPPLAHKMLTFGTHWRPEGD